MRVTEEWSSPMLDTRCVGALGCLATSGTWGGGGKKMGGHNSDLAHFKGCHDRRGGGERDRLSVRQVEREGGCLTQLSAVAASRQQPGAGGRGRAVWQRRATGARQGRWRHGHVGPATLPGFKPVQTKSS
jgi:hypothetical protein